MRALVITIGLLFSKVSAAGIEQFSKGPVFDQYGENAVVDGAEFSSAAPEFKVVFDIAEPSANDGPNRAMNSVTRFINMHVRAGVPVENVNTAIVVHGKAAFELMDAEAYEARFNKSNPSLALVQALLEHGVPIFLCGQSAAFSDIKQEHLIDGVVMSLSAMTANAELQQQGYTLNPF